MKGHGHHRKKLRLIQGLQRHLMSHVVGGVAPANPQKMSFLWATVGESTAKYSLVLLRYSDNLWHYKSLVEVSYFWIRLPRLQEDQEDAIQFNALRTA